MNLMQNIADKAEIERLECQNAELLAVLRYAVDNPGFDSAEFDRMARIVIDKAEGLTERREDR